MELTEEKLVRMIDHSALKPNATAEEIKKKCEECKKYKFAALTVNLSNVALAAKLLKGTSTKVNACIGFPFGATIPEAKAFETKKAIEYGAEEIDMVINIGALRSGDYDLVRDDVKAVVQEAKSHGDIAVKVILETGYLTDEEKVKACQLIKEAGADFVKTSTGFGPSGATIHDVSLMRRTVGDEMGVKAAGGIHYFEDAAALVEAGTTRLGVSHSLQILEGLKAKRG